MSKRAVGNFPLAHGRKGERPRAAVPASSRRRAPVPVPDPAGGCPQWCLARMAPLTSLVNTAPTSLTASSPTPRDHSDSNFPFQKAGGAPATCVPLLSSASGCRHTAAGSLSAWATTNLESAAQEVKTRQMPLLFAHRSKKNTLKWQELNRAAQKPLRGRALSEVPSCPGSRANDGPARPANDGPARPAVLQHVHPVHREATWAMQNLRWSLEQRKSPRCKNSVRKKELALSLCIARHLQKATNDIDFCTHEVRSKAHGFQQDPNFLLIW